MSNLIDTFKEAIDTATTNWNRYKEKENAYKGKVNEGLVELERLIEKLTACIDKLRDLQGDYVAYISRITRIREGMQTMLDVQIGQIRRDTSKDCDTKIKELLEKFQGFVSQIGEWEGDANRFADLLKALDDEIKRLCDEADRIVAQNDDNRSKLDEELRKVEERLNPEGSASKEDADDDETKGGETREQQLARLARMEAELERRRQQQQSRQPRQVSTSTPEGFSNEQRRQQKIKQLRRTGMSRDDKIAKMRTWDRDNNFGAIARNPTAYNSLFESGVQRGGWQTPQKLESISRYSPIRRVERKKKKKNTKKNKKNKRKRRKQTKRRRKKRN